MNWSKGLSGIYYAKKVDPITWRDTDRIEIVEGSVKRERTGLMQSAEINCINYNASDEQYIRIYMDAWQSGSSEHIPIFTGLAVSPDTNYNGARAENEVQCYSVLKPADDIYLQRGWYAASETDGGLLIKQLLSVCPAPVNVSDAEIPYLKNAIIAEDKETRLTMVEKILTAIDWEIRINGAGEVIIQPKQKNPVVVFDPLENDMIETEIKVSYDWYNCPNVFMAIADDIIGIAKDENPNSPLSIQNRGREVWMREDDVNLGTKETIAQYAMRRLKEEQSIYKTASYDRRFHPDVMPGNIIQMHYPAQGLQGNYRVESQDIEVGYGARTSEDITEVLA